MITTCSSMLCLQSIAIQTKPNLHNGCPSVQAPMSFSDDDDPHQPFTLPNMVWLHSTHYSVG